MQAGAKHTCKDCQCSPSMRILHIASSESQADMSGPAAFHGGKPSCSDLRVGFKHAASSSGNERMRMCPRVLMHPRSTPKKCVSGRAFSAHKQPCWPTQPSPERSGRAQMI